MFSLVRNKHEKSLVIVINFLPSIFIFQIFDLIFHVDKILRMGNFVIYLAVYILQKKLKFQKTAKYNPHENYFT